MIINKSWFYKLSVILKAPLLDKEGLGVVIENNLIISIFDDLPFSSSPLEKEGESKGVVINLWKNSKVEIFWILENALNMIIEVKIENLFSCLRMYDKRFYEQTLEKI